MKRVANYRSFPRKNFVGSTVSLPKEPKEPKRWAFPYEYALEAVVRITDMSQSTVYHLESCILPSEQLFNFSHTFKLPINGSVSLPNKNPSSWGAVRHHGRNNRPFLVRVSFKERRTLIPANTPFFSDWRIT